MGDMPLFDQHVAEDVTTPVERAFRDVYYGLYSNSDTSRAERIFEDLAKLLLLKALAERDGAKRLVQDFIAHDDMSSGPLLDVLADRFPQMVPRGDGFSIGDSAVRSALAALESVDTLSCPSSTLGDAFQALIGPRIRGDKGQFFTPRTLVSAMVRIAAPNNKDKIVDPAAGTGGFLVAAHAFRVSECGEAAAGPLIGIDRDPDLFRLGGAMVELATDGIARYHCANSLDMRALRAMEDHSPFEADLVLTNPPFGARIGITDKNLLEQFEFGHIWVYSESEGRWCRTRVLRQSQDPQVLFLELCLDLVRPGGLVGIVLPEGVFGNRQSGYIWDYVRANGTIEALIDCPRTAFQPGTDTKTNVVFIRRITTGHGTLTREHPLIAIAKHCGHDRRGRTHNNAGERVQDDFAVIAETYRQPGNDVWSSCEITDPYYMVPRFYHGKIHSELTRSDSEFTGDVLTIGQMLTTRQITMRKGNEVGAEAYGTGDIPFIRTSDISNWEVSLNPTNGVSEEVYERFRKVQRLRPYDILLVVDGRYRIGRTAILHEHNCCAVVQSHLRIITVNPVSPITPYELLYLLNLPSVLEELRNLTFIQSTLGSLGKRLEHLEIPVPKRTEEWTAKIVDFGDALSKRAGLLAVLKQWENPEPEL